MPSISEKQRRKMGIALAIKRGKVPASYSPEAARMSKEMTAKQLRDYAKKRKRKRKITGRALKNYLSSKGG